MRIEARKCGVESLSNGFRIPVGEAAIIRKTPGKRIAAPRHHLNVRLKMKAFRIDEQPIEIE
jgi:hypothetical protein